MQSLQKLHVSKFHFGIFFFKVKRLLGFIISEKKTGGSGGVNESQQVLQSEYDLYMFHNNVVEPIPPLVPKIVIIILCPLYKNSYF